MPASSTLSLAKRNSAYHHAATYCVLSPLLLIVAGGLFDAVEILHSISLPTLLFLEVLVPLGIMLSGISCGIIALLGMPVHGRAGLLGKCAWGLSLYALILLVVLVRG